MKLPPGLLMEVTVKGPVRQVIVVPEESLESRAKDHFLWVVEDEVAQG